MGLGLGGIVASGLAGAVEGAGQGMATNAIEQQKQDALLLQQQQLASLNQQTHAVNLKADATSAQENALPNAQATANAAAAVQPTVTATRVADQVAMTPSDAAKAGAISKAQAQGKADVDGVTHKEGDIVTNADGSVTTYAKTAQPTDKATSGYYDAIVQKINAETDNLVAGNKSGKMNLPEIIHTDVDGKPVLLDKKSGLMGTIVPGKDAIPAETHWFQSGPLGSADKPGTPAVPMHVEWSDAAGNKVDFDARYPDLARIAAGKTAAGQPPISPQSGGTSTSPTSSLPGPAGKTVVAIGKDKNGNPVKVQYSDGSTGPYTGQ